ncbi:hypothetical protein [Deinococcus altitudinis]|uniref:hypothetical protein n=1 Tax=Deinococcus altitudinis TaxID=468914 RepID=UPI00389152EB
MYLERATVLLSWCFLTLAALPSLGALLYWLTLLPEAFSPPAERDPGQVLLALIIALALLVLGAVSAVGWKILQPLRRAVQSGEPAAASVWAGSLGYNLSLLALDLILPWPFGWHEDSVSPLLAFMLYGLPAAVALQVWLSAVGCWTARSRP